MKSKVLVFIALVVVGGTVPIVGTATTTQQSEAYTGTHVSFETTNSAVVNYTVNGVVLVDAIEVESESEARQRGGFQAGVDISTMTNLRGSEVTTQSQTETRATIRAESGADIEAHDSNRGNLLIRAGGERQLIGVNVSQNAQAEQESDKRVVVTKDDGTQGTFIVVGEGELAVNEDGDVTAKIGEGSTLAFRQYDGERDDDDREQERMIQEGTAAAEVYVTTAAEGGELAAADVVQYSEDTTVEVVTYSENEIRIMAERAEEDGRVIITSVSEQAFEAMDDIEVAVDGEAAAQASSYSDLESAIGGDTSKFLVRQQSSAEASADVLVAVNHFSEREITMNSGGARVVLIAAMEAMVTATRR